MQYHTALISLVVVGGMTACSSTDTTYHRAMEPDASTTRDAGADADATVDAARVDARVGDASQPDDAASRTTDASVPDVSVPDASAPDAGAVDASTARDASRADAATPPDASAVPDASSPAPLPPVGDPATRSRADVCQVWTAYRPQATDLWQTAPASQCDQGVLDAQVSRDALARLNQFRWLVGLQPVTIDPAQAALAQQCATTLSAADRFSHYIDSSFACYTPDAATAALRSNITQGVDDPASSIAPYIADWRVADLGHRRWCLDPDMGTTGFGQRGRYSCMYAVDKSRPSSVDNVFYPSAGYYPVDALLGNWSASSKTFDFGSAPQVGVSRVSDGAAMQVTEVTRQPDGYGLNTVSWKVANVRAGVRYEVTIANGSDTLRYRTELVTCP